MKQFDYESAQIFKKVTNLVAKSPTYVTMRKSGGTKNDFFIKPVGIYITRHLGSTTIC